MTEAQIIEIMQLTIKTVTLMGVPIIATVLIVGVVAQILQTVTQLKDQSLSFVPKIFAAGIVFTLSIPWYIQLAVNYTERIYALIEQARL